MDHSKLGKLVILYFLIYVIAAFTWGYYGQKPIPCDAINLCGTFPNIVAAFILIGVWMIPIGLIIFLIASYLIDRKNK